MACSSRPITHRHADPFVMQEASDRLHVPFYFMAAWQVFAMTHWMGRTVLRQHGCFSVNREGHDMPACRRRASWKTAHLLVIFPEGEVLHLNDRVMPFRRGPPRRLPRGSPHRGPSRVFRPPLNTAMPMTLGRGSLRWSASRPSTVWGCKPSASCRWPSASSAPPRP